MQVGVDEAGRGPVLGSMFVTAVAVPTGDVLREAFPGLDDSKRLSAPRRERLARELEAHPRVRSETVEVPIADIDDPVTDMNSLAVRAHAAAIDGILDRIGAVDPANAATDRDTMATGADSDEEPGAANAASRLETGHIQDLDRAAATVLCDACDTDADRFARRVAEACESGLPIDAAHGADGHSPVVSAASVLAKSAREAHVATLAEEFGAIGSGYPADPATREFLEEYVTDHADLPPIARRSWSTCEDLLDRVSQADLDGF